MHYKTAPVANSFPINFDNLEEKVRYYSDGKFCFGLFSNGTCFFPKTFDRAADQGREMISALGDSPIDFVVKEMDDNNYVVRFSDQIFSVVFLEEFEKCKAEVAQQVEESGPEEALVAARKENRSHMLIGIFARTRLLKDLEDLDVVRVFDKVRA